MMTASNNPFWNKKTVALITGGSQNIGRAVVQHFLNNVAQGSTVIVTSRSLARLERNLAQIKSVHSGVQVLLEQMDLANPPESEVYRQRMAQLIGTDSGTQFEVAIVVHNAAALGDVSKRVIEMDDARELQYQFNVNVVSMAALNAAFLNSVRQVKTKIVVNMSADTATEVLPSFGMVSMVHAARFVLLNTLAKEESDVKVLHFDPHAVDTESMRQIRDKSHDSNIRKWIQDLYDQSEVMTPDQCACKLVQMLASGQIESGQTISLADYTT